MNEISDDELRELAVIGDITVCPNDGVKLVKRRSEGGKECPSCGCTLSESFIYNSKIEDEVRRQYIPIVLELLERRTLASKPKPAAITGNPMWDELMQETP